MVGGAANTVGAEHPQVGRTGVQDDVKTIVVGSYLNFRKEFGVQLNVLRG